MSEFSQTQQQSRTIKRTLCIGLGGTGRDVLMQIRKLIIDRHGKLNNLPVVSFVHIDADKGAGDISGLRTGSTYRGEDILFREAERVVASMSSQEIDDLTQGLNQRESYERRSPYDHIGRWLSPHLLKNIKAIEDGASGIRPVGRLAFFHNYRKIQAAVLSAENRTRGHDRYLIEKGLIIEPGLNIFVVGSLCGGTGSGMFLDVAYGLRQAYGDVENQLIGYWVVSPELYGNTPSMNANAYAALKELNHYAASNSRFNACYDPQHLINVSEQRPPFDYVYVVSNKTATDYKILDKSKLCNVIAHKIFLDFGDELTPIIQGQKNNFLERLARTDEHPRRNVQRYLTFGLAKLYFPNDRTVQIALNQIKENLITFWIDGEGQSPDPQVLLDRFLLDWETNRNSSTPFINQLEVLAQEKNKTFSQILKGWSNQIEESINSLQKANDRQRLLEQLPGDIRAQFRKVQPGETDNARGIWLTLVQQSTQKLSKKLQQDIEQFLAELLQPSSADFSLESARTWLEALLTYLNESRRSLEDSLQSLDGLHSTDDLEKKWRNTSQRLQDIEQQRSLLGLQEKKKNQQFQEEVQQFLQSSNKLFRQNFDYILHQEALKIAKELQVFVQTLISQGTQLNSLLKTVVTLYEKRRNDLLRLNEDDITGEALFAEEDTKECYKFFLPEREYSATLIEVSQQILKEVSENDSLIKILAQERYMDDQQLRLGIDTAFDKRFSNQSNDVKQSVIQRFLQKYPFVDAERRMKQILREAEPLLPLNLSDRYFYNDKGNKSEVIAFKQTDERNTQQFQDMLIRNLGIGGPVLKPIQSDSEIVIVNEYAAFPLRLIDGLEQMREQYNRQCQYDASLIHNDYNQIFCEIIPPNAQKMEELQDVFYACLAFGVLREDDRGYAYEYFDGFLNRYERIELSSSWSEALEQLATTESITQDLKQERDNIILSIKQDPTLWQQDYLPKLRAFIERVSKLSKSDINYPEVSKVLGEKETLDKPEKQGILQRLWDYLNSEVTRSGKTQPETQQYLPVSAVRTDKPQIEAANDRFERQANSDGKSINNPIVTATLDPWIEEAETPKNLIQELEKLADLHQQGMLSDQQFEAFKQKLLDQ
jgi:hypothetical protein